MEHYSIVEGNEMFGHSPGWVAYSVGALFRYTKTVGSIPNQVTYKKQPTNTCNKWGHQIDVSFSLPLSLFKSITRNFKIFIHASVHQLE